MPNPQDQPTPTAERLILLNPAHALLAPEAGCLSSGDSARGPNRRGSLTGRLMLGIGLAAAPAGVALDNALQTFSGSGSAVEAECLNPRWGTNANGNEVIVCDPSPGGGGGGEEEPKPTWEEKIAELCKDIPNLELGADELKKLIRYDDSGNFVDGSGRLATFVRECNIIFQGEYIAELGRRLTGVEFAIADPANRMTPNQPQTDKLQQLINDRVEADRQANPGLYPVPTTTTIAETTTTDAAPTTTTTEKPDTLPATTVASGGEVVPTTATGDKKERSSDSSNNTLLAILAAAGVAGVTSIVFGARRKFGSRRDLALSAKVPEYGVSPAAYQAAATKGRGKMPGGAATTRSAHGHDPRNR